MHHTTAECWHVVLVHRCRACRPTPVTVEVDLAPGLSGIQLVGLPDKAIQEPRERLRSALCNSGFRGPLVRLVINLALPIYARKGPPLICRLPWDC